jgi:hypothetical protein
MKDTQKEMIFNYLMTGARLDPINALRWFGCYKLSTRCGEIERETGIRIDREWKQVKSRFGVKEFKEYFIKLPKI